MSVEAKLQETKDQWAPKALLGEALAGLFETRNAVVLLRGRTFVSIHLTEEAAHGTARVLDPHNQHGYRTVPAFFVYPRQKRERKKS